MRFFPLNLFGVAPWDGSGNCDYSEYGAKGVNFVVLLVLENSEVLAENSLGMSREKLERPWDGGRCNFNFLFI